MGRRKRGGGEVKREAGRQRKQEKEKEGIQI